MYCKCIFRKLSKFGIIVLIVAKCIVNGLLNQDYLIILLVLIVAKCIVNRRKIGFLVDSQEGINSSKVYCKCNLKTSLIFLLYCINSSKVYCKCFVTVPRKWFNVVLIVAKCIVNTAAISGSNLKIQY